MACSCKPRNQYADRSHRTGISRRPHQRQVLYPGRAVFVPTDFVPREAAGRSGPERLEQLLRVASTQDLVGKIAERYKKQCPCNRSTNRLPTLREIEEVVRLSTAVGRMDKRIHVENCGREFSRAAQISPISDFVNGASTRSRIAVEDPRGAGPRLLDPRIREAANANVAHSDHRSVSRSILSVNSGAFDLEFEPYWYESTSPEDQYDTLEYVWSPYYSRSALKTYSEINDMIKKWTPSTSTAEYKFWDSGWGGAHRTFLHAVRLLDVYRGYIINGGTNCPNAGIAFQNRYTDSGYKLKVDNWNGCDATPDEITYDSTTNNIPTDIAHVGSRGAHNRTTHSIHACANLVEGQGHVTDYLLYWAHRARMYSFELLPDIVSAIYYLWQSQRLGRLALGSVSMISRTLLHEMMHREFGRHCENGCCMQRIALRWQCRVFSVMGLYVADSDNGIDLGLDGTEIDYVSECSGSGDNFRGSCQMNNPGTQSSYEDWTGRDDWTNPDGCPS